MKINLEYKNNPVKDFQELVSKYPKSEFDSPYRSTIPFLIYWKNTKEQLISLSQLLEIEFVSEMTLGFEFCVPPQRGNGRSSQTDLMIFSEKNAIAIEAKYTEPPYEDVQSWMGDSLNKIAVLEGWLDLLNSISDTRQIEIQDILSLPYQLVHRCASVCSLAVQQRVLLYQCFDLDQEKIEYYKLHLFSLKRLLSTSMEIFLFNVPMIKSPSYKTLHQRWDNNERNMRSLVVEGIQGVDFINFRKPKVVKI